MVRSKRISLLLIAMFMVSICASSVGFAATVGNPCTTHDPEGAGVFTMRRDSQVTIKASEDFEFIIGRDLVSTTIPEIATNIEIDSAQWYTTKLYYGMFDDRIMPYVHLGLARLKAAWTESGIGEVKLESENGFTWGAGVKALIWDFERPKIKLIGDCLYRMANLEGEEGHVAGVKTTLDAPRSKFAIWEWQFALLVAGEIELNGGRGDEVLGVSKLVPYAGIKYSDMNGRLRLQEAGSSRVYNPGALESDSNFGIVAGCDILGTDSVLLNLEGRFLDEEAFTAGIAVTF